jgi:Cytochrome c7 and related cytochrome c
MPRLSCPCRRRALFFRKAIFCCTFALLAVVFACQSVDAQISPGPLSKAHQSLTGTTQCASCHQFGTKTPTFRCLECHKEIAKLLSESRGYHARMEMNNPNSKDCVRCHLEHNGSDFPLVHWEVPIKQFDHKLTGYPLEGKHAAVVCEKCHVPAHITSDIRPLLKRQDLEKGYLGQSRQCITCHEDYHKGQLGKNCESCHNVMDWKAAKQFDHSKTRYPLTGLHAQVKCEACHKPDTPGGPARFKDMKFATCTSCHSDPHRGEFKQKCEDCHTTVGWKKIAPQFAFDHSKAKYPLEGEHQKVSCVACHTGGDFKRQLAFANCTDCHKDIHSGQFAERTKKGECSECHTVQGWKPSLFGVKEHGNSKYPLQGKHVNVECAKCHIPAGKETVYKVKFAACGDCHKDAHDNQFATAPFKDHCETCHTVTDFHRSLYTIAMHRSSKFPLTGAHAAVPCAECHAEGKGGRKDKVLPFRFSDTSCTACHADPHHGEFKDRMERKRPNGTAFGCEACHSTKSWTAVNGFDHSKTSFPLLGAHRTVTCGACHKVPAGMKDIQFKGTTKQCEGCHTEPHGAQFKDQAGKTPCESCHDLQRWVPSTFDHDKRTKLPLQGGHADVKCDKCHMLTKLIGGNPVTFYKPTPLRCDECHGNLTPDQKYQVPHPQN